MMDPYIQFPDLQYQVMLLATDLCHRACLLSPCHLEILPWQIWGNNMETTIQFLLQNKTKHCGSQFGFTCTKLYLLCVLLEYLSTVYTSICDWLHMFASFWKKNFRYSMELMPISNHSSSQKLEKLYSTVILHGCTTFHLVSTMVMLPQTNSFTVKMILK